MLARQPLDREDAPAAIPPGAGGPADLREGSRAPFDGVGDRTVVHHMAVADDHRWPPHTCVFYGQSNIELGKANLNTARAPAGTVIGCHRPAVAPSRSAATRS